MNRRSLALAAVALVAVALAGCGDGPAPAVDAGSVVGEIEILTLDPAPLRAPFPVLLVAAEPSLAPTRVMLHYGAGSRSVTLYHGRGTATLESSLPGWLRLRAGAGARTIEVAARGAREVAGTLSGADLAWDSERDVRVTADLDVPAGETLTVAAGTRVLIEPEVSIEIHGRLEVAGTAEAPVLFTAASEPWGGVRVLGGEAALADSWLVGGGGDASLAFGHSSSQPVIYVEGGSLAMSGGGLIDNPGKALGSQDATVALTGVLISRCDTGGELVDSEATIDGGWFLEMPDADGVLDDDDNDGIYLRGVRTTGGEVRESLVRDTVFAVGEDDAIDHNDAQVRVERCWIEGFAHEGVAASTGHTITVVDTVVKECEQGIEAGYGSPEVVVDHCLVTGCDTGLRYGDSYDWEVTGHLSATSTVAVENGDNVRNYVNLLGGPAADAIDISCSMVDDPDWDGVAGNLAGTPSWQPGGCLEPGSPGSAAACDGGAVGPRRCW